jgi:hypothetical protein
MLAAEREADIAKKLSQKSKLLVNEQLPNTVCC